MTEPAGITPAAAPAPAAPAPIVAPHQMQGDALVAKYASALPDLDRVEDEGEGPESAEEMSDDAPEPETEGESAETPAAAPAATGGTPEAAAKPKLPAIQFRTLDESGAEVSIPKGLKVEIEVNGQKRAYPLDVVARLARQGHVAAKATEEYHTAMGELEDHRARVPEIQKVFEEREAMIFRLLDDPDYYREMQTKVEESKTSDSKLKRYEEREAREAEENEMRAEDQAGAQEFAASLGPVFNEATGPYLAVIGAEPIMDRLHALMAPLPRRRDGKIRIDAYPRVKYMIESRLVPWMEATAATKIAEQSLAASTAAGKIAADVRAERETRSLEKREDARTLKPTGKRAPGAPTTTGREAPARTADERVSRSINKHLQGLG